MVELVEQLKADGVTICDEIEEFDKDGEEYLAVNNSAMVYMLINSVKELNHKIEKYPVNIIRCEDCTLLQLDYIVDQKKVYHLS